MQKVTSSSDQVVLNTTPNEIKSRFGTHEVTWDKVKNPAGSNIVSRIAHAVYETLKNLLQYVYNAAVWAPNKVHSMLYPKAASESTANDDVTMDQDSVIVDVYENTEANANQIQEDSAVIAPAVAEEKLADPITQGTSWKKVSLYTTGGTLATAAVVIGGAFAATRFYPDTIPYAREIAEFFTTNATAARTFVCTNTGLCTP